MNKKKRKNKREPVKKGVRATYVLSFYCCHELKELDELYKKYIAEFSREGRINEMNVISNAYNHAKNIFGTEKYRNRREKLMLHMNENGNYLFRAEIKRDENYSHSQI